MTTPANLRGRLAAVGLSVVLLGALLFPAGAINENQAPPAAPELTLPAAASGALFAQIDDGITSNLGLRIVAVRAFARAHQALGVSPTPQVFLGAGGRPFLAADFSNACANDLAAMDFAQTVDQLAAAQQYAGREFLFVVVPDKSSIDRDDLGPLGAQLLACSDRNRAYLEGVPSLLTAWDSFEQSPDELFLYGDSHWNYTGASTLGRDILESLAPGIVQPGDQVETEAQHTGDLFLLMGIEQQEGVTIVTTERDGVETGREQETTALGYRVQRWQSSGDARFITGRTLIVHDSTFGYNSAYLAPYFEDLTSIPLQTLSQPGALASLGDYDRVIVQQVQRTLPDNLGALLAADWL